MRSAKLLSAFKAIHYWHRGFHTALWSRARHELHSEEQRQAIREAEGLAIQSMQKLEAIFGPEIGRALIAELK